MSEMRPAIIKLHEKGYSVRKIEEMLDVPRSTVQDHIKRFEETRSNKDRKGSFGRLVSLEHSLCALNILLASGCPLSASSLSVFVASSFFKSFDMILDS